MSRQHKNNALLGLAAVLLAAGTLLSTSAAASEREEQLWAEVIKLRAELSEMYRETGRQDEDRPRSSLLQSYDEQELTAEVTRLRAELLRLAEAWVQDRGGSPAATYGQGEFRPLAERLHLTGFYQGRYYNDFERDNDTEQYDEFRNDLRIRMEPRITDAVLLHVSGDARVDRSKSEAAGGIIEEEELRLWEAYVKVRLWACDVWIGQQAIRWGKSDEINPTDNFTPEDFSEFINFDRAERKLPVLMGRMNIYAGEFVYEAVYLPRFEPSPNISRNSDWYPHALRSLEEDGLAINENESFESMDDYVFANRLIYRGALFDVGLSYARHFNQIAALTMAAPEVVFGYFRQNSVGTEFEATVGGLGVRGEAVYTTDEPLGTFDPEDADGIVLKDTLTWVLGCDYTFRNDLYLNVQYHARSIIEYGPDLAAASYEDGLIANLSKTCFREDLKLSLAGRYYLDNSGYYIGPSIEYRVNDHVRVSLVSDMFGGAADNIVGQYRSNNQFGMELRIEL